MAVHAANVKRDRHAALTFVFNAHRGGSVAADIIARCM